MLIFLVMICPDLGLRLVYSDEIYKNNNNNNVDVESVMVMLSQSFGTSGWWNLRQIALALN